MNQEMKYTKSIEDYLEVILMLVKQAENQGVRISDIARELDVKKPSVVRAVNELKTKKLVNHKPYGKIYLTDIGHQKANQILDKHELLYRFLSEIIGVEPKTAEIEACAIEHCICEETYLKLKKFINNWEKSDYNV